MKGLIDTTLREGAQAAGISFTLDDRLRIVEELAAVGIEEIEVGIASPRQPELATLFTALRGKGLTPTRLALWSRCHPADIDVAASLRPDALALSIPVSRLHLEARMGRGHRWALKTMTEAVQRARAGGVPYVSVGFEDATRAEAGFLETMAAAAQAAGAHRIRLADTVGCAAPPEIAALIGRLRSATDLELGFHGHNDFGMATANAITALSAGADWVDVTVLGLGERAGNARLEEVAGYLSLRQKRTLYRPERLRSLCRTVAAAAGEPLSPRQPVVGSAIFTCESGLHLQGIVRHPATYEPYAPERVGAERRLLIGQKVGRRALSDRLSLLGLSLADGELERLVNEVRQRAAVLARPLADAEIAGLARTMLVPAGAEPDGGSLA